MKNLSRIFSASLPFAAAILLLSGCTSTGNLGILSNSETEADLGPHDPHTFHRIGTPRIVVQVTV